MAYLGGKNGADDCSTHLSSVGCMCECTSLTVTYNFVGHMESVSDPVLIQ